MTALRERVDGSSAATGAMPIKGSRIDSSSDLPLGTGVEDVIVLTCDWKVYVPLNQ
jgi:hypothetical protein